MRRTRAARKTRRLAAWRASPSGPAAVDLRALASAADADDESVLAYRVPKATAGGGCALPDVLEDAPVDLRALLAGAAAAAAPRGAPALEARAAARVGALRAGCAALAAAARVEWVGVYERVTLAGCGGGDALVKVAYVGAPSRAAFPLTADFARGSNNSLVGLTGDAVVVADTRALGEDDAYYACDGRVRSEFCLPVFAEAGAAGAGCGGAGEGAGEGAAAPATLVVGIIDAEAWRPRAFDDAAVRALFLDAAAQLGASAFLRAWVPPAPA